MLEADHPTTRAAGSRASASAAVPRKTVMKSYQGTMTPNRRDLSDPRSSGKPAQAPRTPLLNDRRSTR